MTKDIDVNPVEDTTSKQDLTIEYMPLSKLKKHPRNPKEHSLPNIQSSFQRFGYITPAVINEEDGQLLAGHGRLDALLELKANSEEAPKGVLIENDEWFMPVIRGVGLGGAEAEAFLIADNQLSAVGGWQDDRLVEMLEEISETDFGFDGTGFAFSDLIKLQETLDDSVPEDYFETSSLPDTPTPVASATESYLIYLAFPDPEMFKKALTLLSFGKRSSIKGVKQAVLNGSDFVDKWEEALQPE